MRIENPWVIGLPYPEEREEEIPEYDELDYSYPEEPDYDYYRDLDMESGCEE